VLVSVQILGTENIVEGQYFLCKLKGKGEVKNLICVGFYF